MESVSLGCWVVFPTKTSIIAEAKHRPLFEVTQHRDAISTASTLLSLKSRNATMTQFEKGEKIIIHSGPYKHKPGWLNTLKKPGTCKVSIVFQHVDGPQKGELGEAQINKTSFKLAKDVPPPRNFTEVQLLVHTTVMDSLRTAARKVARLGITKSTDAVIVFRELVDEYITILQQAGPKANYFPVAIKGGGYRAFFEAKSEEHLKRARDEWNFDDMEADD